MAATFNRLSFFCQSIINNLILCMGWYFHYSGAFRILKIQFFLETQSPDLYMPVAFLNILSDFQPTDIRCSLCIGVKISKTISLFLLHFQSWFSNHLFWNPPGYLDLSQESKQSHVEACPLTVPPKTVF